MVIKYFTKDKFNREMLQGVGGIDFIWNKEGIKDECERNFDKLLYSLS